ncbi:DUF547 domain-containing protein [Stieleria varia]|uniref:DUF547 domain-containing protein n=1 Tax=Stieleria varia TaxID=2528005 RepID=A0A5C6B2L5_9BACT|nr:DUF547 domain-containing protein [Stieleria varia]TWU06140.1 hypothetical protein Pla52n_18600 [Stieleria varia]
MKKNGYYGPFFWLALISFAVPFVVAAKAFHEVKLTTRPSISADPSGVDHNLWDYLLKSYVDGGLVDYDAMSRDYLFRTYLRQLSEAEPQNLTTATDQLALLCNAYNAFVIDGVIRHKIADSVMNFQQDELGFFDIKEHLFAGKTLSLNQIEHELIRKRFREPRIHVALVCAARDCPSIRREAYTGRRLGTQLQDQSVLFANTPKYVHYDESTNTVQLSPLLDWYGDDWSTAGGYLAWLSGLTEDQNLKQKLIHANLGSVDVVFMDYDWSLNGQGVTQSAGKADTPKASFGSGTVPNQ